MVPAGKKRRCSVAVFKSLSDCYGEKQEGPSENMNVQAQQIKEFVDALAVMAGSSGKSAETGRDGSNSQEMSHEKVTQAAKEPDEIAYLKMILDCLVKNRSLIETGDVDIDGQFLQELRNSVDSILRSDTRIKEDVRLKVWDTFNLLIDNYAKYFRE